MKRVFSIFLCLVIVFSIVFQCSFESSAVIGIDDAILIGTVCLDLASLGVTIYSVSNFAKSDTFKDFCNSIGNGIDNGVSVVKRNGILFFATAKTAWSQLCTWVKTKFSGRQETKTIEFETSQPTQPTSLTLKDGTVVPYGTFMDFPFFIFKTSSNVIRALNCTGLEPGMVWGQSLITIWCKGRGTVNRFDLINGQWSNTMTSNMSYGLTYKGVTGSYFNQDFYTNVGANSESFYLYRTMQRTNSSGTAQEAQPPQSVPEVTEPVPAVVTASSDPAYYPGAVDAPAEVIEEGDQVLIRVPDAMVVDAGTSNPTLTTDIDTIADTIAVTTPSDVKPKVLSQAAAQAGTVDQIITDTPAAELEGTGSVETDIETANKFRLPRSFLEGFPFSIPYSVYVGIQSFVADPQAPVFNIPFSVARLGIQENMEIDLSQWNPVARLCRALLSLVWVAGLAIACGKFIKR